LEMHVSNLDEMRHTFYFGSHDFGPYEIDPIWMCTFTFFFAYFLYILREIK
jgi:hypothetical protein